jgi:hypothetical protein
LSYARNREALLELADALNCARRRRIWRDNLNSVGARVIIPFKVD